MTAKILRLDDYRGDPNLEWLDLALLAEQLEVKIKTIVFKELDGE